MLSIWSSICSFSLVETRKESAAFKVAKYSLERQSKAKKQHG